MIAPESKLGAYSILGHAAVLCRSQLQQDKEALELRVGSLTELVKRKEQENSSLTQSLAAVQAVNQASSDKLAKVGPLIEYEYQIKS